MKSPRAAWMIAFSVVIGLGAVIVASRWVSQQKPMATSKIVVAAGDLELGSRLTPNLLKMSEWPSAHIPAGAMTDMPALDGRVVNTSLLRGEPVLEGKLAPVGSKAGLSSVIGTGRRAITVRVNDVVGVAGFALPGNFVDIVVNTDDDRMPEAPGRSRSMSKIVLERILVLAVAQVASRDETKPKVVNAVTLEVTPEQAEVIDLARSVGNLSLVLRNQVDTSAAGTRGITKFQVLHPGEAEPLAAEATPQGSSVGAAPAGPAAVQPPAAPQEVVTSPVPAVPPPAPPPARKLVRRPRPAVTATQPPDEVLPVPPRKQEIEVIKGGQRSQEGF